MLKKFENIWILDSITEGPLNIWTEHSNCQIHSRGTQKPFLDLVAVTSSEILKAKQKLGVTFNSDKLGGIDFTKFSKLTMCSA